jgi:hypothetical protein
METWPREPDVMDVLKDITDGLRGSDGNESEESDQTGTDARRESASRSTTADSPGKSTDSTEPTPEDVHVCSFCEAEFDAGRDVCPECDAKIVLRGAR